MHLYIHIPFCKQACHYCDFHFSTNTKLKTQMSLAIAKEIEIQKDYFESKNLATIYFGGGTPSLLNEVELDIILNAVHKNFNVEIGAEVTMEANPDDLHKDKLSHIVRSGINRLSIGTQSFHEPHLLYLNRAHNANEAKYSVEMAQNAGISNISIDLIYAIPSVDHAILRNDIAMLQQLQIPHISAYSLTIEPQTVFGNWLQKNKIKAIDEEFAAQQFELLINSLAESGYEQYEISNFAADKKYSRHNSAYWKAHPYLGVGPSAHSYNKTTRSSNVSNNSHYLKALALGEIPATTEILSIANKTNEYLLTGLRTKWGVKLAMLKELSHGRFDQTSQKYLHEFLKDDLIQLNLDTITLTSKGKLFADKIASDLFIED